MFPAVDHECSSGAGLRALPCLAVVERISGCGWCHLGWCPWISVASHRCAQFYLCSAGGQGRLVSTFSFPDGWVERIVDASGAPPGICEPGSAKGSGIVSTSEFGGHAETSYSGS